MQLSESELERLAIFLQKRVGIVLEKQKLLRFSRKIEDVMKKYKFDDFSSFYHAVRFHHNEEITQDLINAVTVNETYFWREHEQFEILSQEILPLYVKNNISTVRILVSPCSSGEEVYSIMLAILESGDLIEKINIEIVGIDIDSNMIQKAKEGLYSKRSVEKLPAHISKKYFTKVGTLYKIDDSLREAATFLQANIFDASIINKLGSFDILFSRNMLIYFNLMDKRRAFDTFYKLLKPKSYLFLGHADASQIDKTKFNPLKIHSHIYKRI
ncbi:MAG: protein-glutamate O-methyltransferase CheR [Sulfurimonas sp.]